MKPIGKKVKNSFIIIFILAMLVLLGMGIRSVVIAYGDPSNVYQNFLKDEAAINITVNFGSSSSQTSRIVIRGKDGSPLTNYKVWLNADGNNGQALLGSGNTKMTTTNPYIGVSPEASSFGIKLTTGFPEANNDTYNHQIYARQAGGQFNIGFHVPNGYTFSHVVNDAPFATFSGLSIMGYFPYNGHNIEVWTYNSFAETFDRNTIDPSAQVGGNGADGFFPVKADIQRLTERKRCQPIYQLCTY